MSIETLANAVQFNCDLSDREFAADYSICIYLIRMREYYRWSHGIAMNEALDQSALMDWVSDTEARWDTITADDFQSLEYQGVSYQPFDSKTLNRALQPQGYTYAAGYGRFGKPVFMLAELESLERGDQYSLTIAGRELARELSAPPAVMQAGDILIRSESVTRLIWDLLEEWQWNKPDNAMAQIVKYYDFEGDALQALERASADQCEVLILHEIGELVAEDLLAPCWNDMLSDENRHRHLFARAVRDSLADCLSTLPGLLAEENTPGIHFYFASLTPLRKSMFPTLAKAYRQWHSSGSIDGIKSAINCGQVHWLNTANRLTDEFISGRPASGDTVQTYIEQNAL
jgi:hypothetical protein